MPRSYPVAPPRAHAANFLRKYDVFAAWPNALFQLPRLEKGLGGRAHPDAAYVRPDAKCASWRNAKSRSLRGCENIFARSNCVKRPHMRR